MSRWFRLYEDVLNDPKLQKLPAETFRGLINIWCIASANGGKLPPMSSIGFLLRMSDADACQLIVDLDEAGLLDTHEDYTCPHNWQARQFKSDDVTARVKRHRERKGTVARNGDETFHETPPEQSRAETDSETEQSERETRTLAISPDWKPKDPKADPAEVKRFVNHYLAKGEVRADWDAAWEVWLSRIADFGKAKAPPPEAAPPADVIWLGEDDPRFGRVAGAHRQRTGKPLIPKASMHGSGFGAWLKPADYPELSTPTP